MFMFIYIIYAKLCKYVQYKYLYGFLTISFCLSLLSLTPKVSYAPEDRPLSLSVPWVGI